MSESTFLVCPGERPAVGFLSQAVPLVTVPLLGESLINYWMENLAISGIREICVLATDRPEIVRHSLQDGLRWGVRVRIQPELKEFTPEEILQRLGHENQQASRITVLEHLPDMPDYPIFRSYRDWYKGVLAWMPRAASLSRIGLRMRGPDIWCGLRTRIAPSAKIHGPCWLGNHVQVGPETVIGPNAILENRVVVDSAAEIRSSIVGPDTFVGALTKVENSIAWGNNLIDWQTGSCTQVPDPFLLSALGTGSPEKANVSGSSIRRLWAALARPWQSITVARRSESTVGFPGKT